MHLMGLAEVKIPDWEPDQGWRVLDPDGHVVNAGPRTLLVATLELGEMLGIDEDQVPLLDGTRRER